MNEQDYETMKALTDWQPFATLIIIGAKKNETRGWATNYRGRIAVHAAKTLSESAKIWTRATPEIGRALNRPLEDLPLGAVLGTVEIVNCQKVIRIAEEENPINGMKHRVAILENGWKVTGDELEFGDYAPGRYAWILRNPRPFARPVPARGAQGLWTWKIDHAG